LFIVSFNISSRKNQGLFFPYRKYFEEKLLQFFISGILKRVAATFLLFVFFNPYVFGYYAKWWDQKSPFKRKN